MLWPKTQGPFYIRMHINALYTFTTNSKWVKELSVKKNKAFLKNKKGREEGQDVYCNIIYNR